jgi:hypothetical protein
MKTFEVGNEFGLVCTVSDCAVNCESDALDWAVDEGYLNGDIMSDDDVHEAIKDGWGDDITYAGNYGLPIRTDYLWIKETSR